MIQQCLIAILFIQIAFQQCSTAHKLRVHVFDTKGTFNTDTRSCDVNGEQPMSVEGVAGIFCVPSPACAGIASGNCPGGDASKGLPWGSYCGKVESGVYGCKACNGAGECGPTNEEDDTGNSPIQTPGSSVSEEDRDGQNTDTDSTNSPLNPDDTEPNQNGSSPRNSNATVQPDPDVTASPDLQTSRKPLDNTSSGSSDPTQSIGTESSGSDSTSKPTTSEPTCSITGLENGDIEFSGYFTYLTSSKIVDGGVYGSCDATGKKRCFNDVGSLVHDPKEVPCTAETISMSLKYLSVKEKLVKQSTVSALALDSPKYDIPCYILDVPEDGRYLQFTGYFTYLTQSKVVDGGVYGSCNHGIARCFNDLRIDDADPEEVPCTAETIFASQKYLKKQEENLKSKSKLRNVK